MRWPSTWKENGMEHDKECREILRRICADAGKRDWDEMTAEYGAVVLAENCHPRRNPRVQLG